MEGGSGRRRGWWRFEGRKHDDPPPVGVLWRIAAAVRTFARRIPTTLRGGKVTSAVDPPFTIVPQATVAQLLLDYLALEGVETLFGVPGGAVMHLLNELKNQRERFRYIVCRQESGAAYIADGYSRVSGKLGVLLVTSGPGATNALTGTMNAQNAGVSMLAITGEVAEEYFGKGYLQEGTDANLNVDAVFGNASGYSVIVSNPSNFQTLFTQALRDALGVPHRAAHISLPDDIAGSALPPTRMPRSPDNYRATPRSSDRRQLRKAFERLVNVDRPLILLGSGARDAMRGEGLALLTDVVDRFAIPVMTTPDAKGIFPESHPLSLRNFGTAFCEWTKYYMVPKLFEPGERGDYDALLVLGTTLGGLATNKWDPILEPKESLVQLDLDPTVIGRVYEIDFGIVAEIGSAIEDLHEIAMSSDPDRRVRARRAFLAKLKQQSPFLDPHHRDSDASPILPQAMMKIISETLPAGANVFVDAGNCVGWCLHHLTIDPPSQIFSALAMGPMGFGVGAVIGGKLAAPERACVAIVGDGAFLMHGAEVSTAAANTVGAIWVVLNDNDLGMVSQGMNQFFPDESGIWNDYYSLGAPDLAGFAKAMGAAAFDVHSPQDFRHAFASALESAALDGTPQVIVAHIDTTQIPPYYQNPGYTPSAPMPNEPITPPAWPKSVGPFSPGIKSGNTIYVSGQGPVDPKTGKFVLGDFADQARLTFNNVKAVIEAGGGTLSDVTQVSVHLSDLSDFATLNTVYEEFFSAPYPARTTVGSELLMHIAIEVDCVAVLST
jgi:acetolactate synthase I/II/III large subunit